MPFNSKEWAAAKYRGQNLIGIKQHKEDPCRFLLEVNIKKIRRRKFVTINESGADLYHAAMDQHATFRADIRAGYFVDAYTFGEVFSQMMAIKSITDRWRTMQTARYYNHVAPFLGGMNVNDIRAQHIDQVSAAARSMKPASQKAIIDLVKATLRHARENKIIKDLPLEARHNVKVIAAQQKTIVTDAQNKFTAVHRAIVTEFANDPAMCCIFLFGLYGRRKAEVLRMEWKHIDFGNGRYLIPGSHSKVKTDFVFTLPDEIARTLRKIKGQRRGLIFKNPTTKGEYSNIHPKYKLIRRSSGWKEFTFHRMRNLLASVLHSRGVSSSHISSVLGHTNPATVLQYLTMERTQPIIEQEINLTLYGDRDPEKANAYKRTREAEEVLTSVF